MAENIHKRFFLCQLKVDKEAKVFYVDEERVKKVDIIGTIVSVKEKYNLYEFEIDDGTGIMKCTLFKEDPQIKENLAKSLAGEPFLEELFNSQNIETQPSLGDLVQILGYLNIYRDSSKITITNIKYLKDENQHWFRVFEMTTADILKKEAALVPPNF